MTARTFRVAVAGNPNVGKTSLFNELTGSRYQVGNYPGVTVERRSGRVIGRLQPERGRWPIECIDLPGTYSLGATSADEEVAFRALHGEGSEAPDAVLLVVDASNLARNLYLALQLLELGRPLVVALNMVDVARDAGLPVEPEQLQQQLGVRVIPTVARTGQGCDAVVQALAELDEAAEVRAVEPGELDTELREALGRLDGLPVSRARGLLSGCAAGSKWAIEHRDAHDLRKLGAAALGAATRQLIAARYAEVDRILEAIGHSMVFEGAPVMGASQRVDRVLTHRVWGLVAFLAVMGLIFTSIFSWAEPCMALIEWFVGWVGGGVARALGPGLLTDLIVDGVISGVGNVIVFVPQIALLFLFLGLLEDSGYMARAAFLMDRLMARVGLHGRAFVPLLSGYACAIPAIMGTRTIANFRDRLVAILMIPFMSCSARLPIYALVVAAFFVGDRAVAGVFSERGLVLLAMYLLSTGAALGMGFIYKRTLLRGPVPPLVLELPPYRIPRVRNTLLVVVDRVKDFIRNAGTVILAFTIILWALLSFPRAETGAGMGGPTDIANSYGGRAAQVLEPAWEPIGQDWRVGIGIIGSFAAREVLVSTMGLVYGLESADDDMVPLAQAMRETTDSRTGKPRYDRLTGLSLMVFFVFACQCMSTLAVVRRETHSWRWPAFMFVTMTAIAYIAALIVYQGGRALGF